MKVVRTAQEGADEVRGFRIRGTGVNMGQGKNREAAVRNEAVAKRNKLICDKEGNESGRKENTYHLNSAFHFQNTF